MKARIHPNISRTYHAVNSGHDSKSDSDNMEASVQMLSDRAMEALWQLHCKQELKCYFFYCYCLAGHQFCTHYRWNGKYAIVCPHILKVYVPSCPIPQSHMRNTACLSRTVQSLCPMTTGSYSAPSTTRRSSKTWETRRGELQWTTFVIELYL